MFAIKFLDLVDKWEQDSAPFRKDIAMCVDGNAALSSCQQTQLIRIVNQCVERGKTEIWDAMQIATWINSCRIDRLRVQ